MTGFNPIHDKLNAVCNYVRGDKAAFRKDKAKRLKEEGRRVGRSKPYRRDGVIDEDSSDHDGPCAVRLPYRPDYIPNQPVEREDKHDRDKETSPHEKEKRKDSHAKYKGDDPRNSAQESIYQRPPPSASSGHNSERRSSLMPSSSILGDGLGASRRARMSAASSSNLTAGSYAQPSTWYEDPRAAFRHMRDFSTIEQDHTEEETSNPACHTAPHGHSSARSNHNSKHSKHEHSINSAYSTQYYDPREAFKNQFQRSAGSSRSRITAEPSTASESFKTAKSNFSESKDASKNGEGSNIRSRSPSPDFGILPNPHWSHHTASKDYFMSGALPDGDETYPASRHKDSSVLGRSRASSQHSSSYASARVEQPPAVYIPPYVETVSDFSGSANVDHAPSSPDNKGKSSSQTKTTRTESGNGSDLAAEYAKLAINRSDMSGNYRYRTSKHSTSKNGSNVTLKPKQKSITSSENYQIAPEYTSSQTPSGSHRAPFTSPNEAMQSQETLITERGIGNMTRTYVEGMNSEARTSRESVITEKSRREIASEYGRYIGDMNRTHLEGMEESQEVDGEERRRRKWFRRSRE